MLGLSMAFSDRIVLDYLDAACADSPEVTLRLKDIAEDTNVSFPTVQRALKRLEQSGAIERERQTAYIYTYKVVKHG